MTEPVKLVPVQRQIVEGTIKVLEEYLELARAGEIKHVVVLASHPNGGLPEWRRSGFDDLATLIGEVEIIKHRLLQQLAPPVPVPPPPPAA